MAQQDDIVEERVTIAANDRGLEGRLAYPAEREPGWCALIASPHPLLGGNLENNLVLALHRQLAAHGAVTLAYNYAGVGQSEGGPADWPTVMSLFWQNGCFDEERDWLDDTQAAWKALRDWCSGPMVAIGYSFGCWAVTDNLPESGARAVVLISPNTKKHDLCLDTDGPRPLLVIHSTNDFTCPVENVEAWFAAQHEPKRRVLIDAGEHFFRGREADVVKTVLDFLGSVELGIDPIELP